MKSSLLSSQVRRFGFTLAFAILPLMSLPENARAQETFPEPDTREEIDDWVLECYRALDQCQVYQRVLINNGSAIAMVSTMAWDTEEDVLRVQLALPLGIDLSAGASISIDGAEPMKLPVGRCTQRGCLIEGHITDQLVSRLRAGTAAIMTVVNPPEDPFPIPMSLRGLDAALKRIVPDRPQPEPTPEPTPVPTPAPQGAVSESTDGAAAGAGGGPTAESVVPEVTAPSLSQDGEKDEALRPVTGSGN